MPANSSPAVPRRRASCSSHPPRAPAAAPTPAPMSSSTAALPGAAALSSPAAAAAPAIATITTGVAMPSLRPLSTVISWRIRDGTAGFVTTGIPRAASVGASAAPTRRASHSPNWGKNQRARAHPNTIVSGRPAPSSRTYRPTSRRNCCRGRRAASEKSTQTSVSSSIGVRPSGGEEPSTSPDQARAAPTAVKTTGAVRSDCCSRAETRAHANRRAVIKTMDISSMTDPGAIRRA